MATREEFLAQIDKSMAERASAMASRREAEERARRDTEKARLARDAELQAVNQLVPRILKLTADKMVEDIQKGICSNYHIVFECIVPVLCKDSLTLQNELISEMRRSGIGGSAAVIRYPGVISYELIPGDSNKPKRRGDLPVYTTKIEPAKKESVKISLLLNFEHRFNHTELGNLFQTRFDQYKVASRKKYIPKYLTIIATIIGNTQARNPAQNSFEISYTVISRHIVPSDLTFLRHPIWLEILRLASDTIVDFRLGIGSTVSDEAGVLVLTNVPRDFSESMRGSMAGTISLGAATSTVGSMYSGSHPPPVAPAAAPLSEKAKKSSMFERLGLK
ncbi:MAG: hypothetical protein KBD64_00380 [Gammaproteobacteria bacterium]|nr:hypothetical protein [Gammaproteobacteria bacterium]